VVTAALLALVTQALPLLRQGAAFYQANGAAVLLLGGWSAGCGCSGSGRAA